jgi:DNA repair protein RadD
VLYVQGSGRGLRIAPGKVDCLWLDFTDTTDRLGPVDSLKGRKKRDKKENQSDPQKICEYCGEVVRPASLMKCPSCGMMLWQLEVKEAVAVSDAPIMAHQVQSIINTYPVNRVAYSVHKKEGKPDSLRVDYYSGTGLLARKVATEFICFEHGGFARARAAQWWRKRDTYTGDFLQVVPDSTRQAFSRFKEASLMMPVAIRVNETDQYPKIISFEWAPQEEFA